jgi:hypothetical protein
MSLILEDFEEKTSTSISCMLTGGIRRAGVGESTGQKFCRTARRVKDGVIGSGTGMYKYR